MNPAPPGLCRHFGSCGGCAYQDLDETAYRALKREEIVRALARHGLDPSSVEPLVSVPPGTRRRAALKATKRNDATEIGFHAKESHTIVDMRECRVLTPALVALVGALRDMMDAVLGDGEKAELHVTETGAGPDVAIVWARQHSPSLVSKIAHWAGRLGLARVTAGNDILFEHTAPFVRLGRAAVLLPPRAFLQPSRDGEALLQERVVEIAGKAKRVLDLFAGCGTLTFPLAERARVHAVEWDAPMLDALAGAARATQGLKPIAAERRDLARNPVAAQELRGFDAVVLDPPRAGALAQAKMLAGTGIGRIAYVSCNPATFARDARVLTEGGFHLSSVLPVDQFLWSSHIELVAGFRRG